MTTLTVTRHTDAAFAPGLVGAKLVVAAAPTPPATVYASSFTAGLDGWTVGDSDTTATLAQDTDATDPPTSLRLRATDDHAVAVRTVTGLTVGASYTFQVDVNRAFGDVQLGVQGVAGGTKTTPVSSWTTLSMSFTATATSHVIRVNIWRSGGTWSTAPDYRFRNVKVYGPTGTWKGLRVYRTDANGTSVLVRNFRKLDTTAGTATLYDYEAALVGTVSYTAYDGLDGTATASGVQVGAATDQAIISLPLSGTATSQTVRYVAVFKVTGWTEAQASIGRTHQIIGRTDKVGNPGPLAMRVGTFDVLGLTYDDVLALRTLLDEGLVAFLRQPTHKGLDLYFTVTDISTRPDTESLTWTATVAYEEVPRP